MLITLFESFYLAINSSLLSVLTVQILSRIVRLLQKCPIVNLQNAMQPGSSQGATVIQVTKNPISATHTIIQQNGQHLLVGKISNTAGVTTADATEMVSESNTNGGTTVQTLLPAQYIETASAESTVYATAVSTASGNNPVSSGNSSQV